jgi:acyl dehydratase
MADGLYCEEISVGDKWVTACRTITEADVITFAGMTADYNPLHTDEPWCKSNSKFGTRIAHGMLVSSIALGLWCRTGLGDGTAIAAMGCSWEYLAPVLIGDTIHVEVEVTEMKQSTSKPEQGIQVLGYTVLNQNGEVVQKATFKAMKRWYRPKDKQ